MSGAAGSGNVAGNVGDATMVPGGPFGTGASGGGQMVPMRQGSLMMSAGGGGMSQPMGAPQAPVQNWQNAANPVQAYQQYEQNYANYVNQNAAYQNALRAGAGTGGGGFGTGASGGGQMVPMQQAASPMGSPQPFSGLGGLFRK